MPAIFSDAVAEQIKFYVYRLIDPRNGETFYVGKGKGNRVFSHAAGRLGDGDEGEDELNAKMRRIREIQAGGFEVGHVIHRHGLTEDQAMEVEAALIDAFPAATNDVAGRGSDERGVRHFQEIIEQYEALEAEIRHRLVAITINRYILERENIYEAVRYAWRLNPGKANKAEYVLAVERGLIVGVFVALQWLEATPANFPGTGDVRVGRWGFIGEPAPPKIAAQYLR
jgi:hypothetical protein